MSDLFTDLADGEDAFDVDLMAAGCRLPLPRPANPRAQGDDGIEHLVTIYSLDTQDLVALLAHLVSENLVDRNEIARAAEAVALAKVTG